jgi:N-acetylglucosaminyldiphosphoundecaprenol N-acetyl-beta-D-mannosaminyltransferase
VDDAKSLHMGRDRDADDRSGTSLFRGLGHAGYVELRLQDSIAVRLIDLAPPQVAARLAQLLRGGSAGEGPVTVAFMNMRNFVAVQGCPAALAAFAAVDQVYADGVGLQLGRRLAGLPRFGRVSGTDTVPLLLREVPEGTRVFLLGGSRQLSEAAASHFTALFPAAVLAGAHHGYFPREDEEQVLARIDAASPDILLVGMGSPLQEQWLLRHRSRLRCRLAICVGGLFHYWSQDLRRAPRTLQEIGLEWVWILAQQPFKWPVYTIDAARFGAVLVHRRRLTLS